MAAETAAERLHELYVDELRRSLLPPVRPMVNRRQIEALIRRARTAEAAACTEPDAMTWIWSDLHLGHEQSRSAFGRPFRTAAAADQGMMEAWYEQVAEGETIICLGDVTVDGEALAHHQEWWRKAPGAKWLVLGNHDVDPVNQIRPFEVDRTAVTLYAAVDPPLLLTHVPLLQVPQGAVNVHGHVHEQESPTPNRHVNVSVEQLNYRPTRLSEIRRLARRLMEGRAVPGHTTQRAAESRQTGDAVSERPSCRGCTPRVDLRDELEDEQQQTTATRAIARTSETSSWRPAAPARGGVGVPRGQLTVPPPGNGQPRGRLQARDQAGKRVQHVELSTHTSNRKHDTNPSSRANK